MDESFGWTAGELSALLLHEDKKTLVHKLDQTMRSPPLSRQCQAIALFPRVLGHNADPILVDTVLLRLAELFHDSPNALRVAVVEALYELRVYLRPGKLPSVDFLVSHVMAVLAANDPVARSTQTHAHANTETHAHTNLHTLTRTQTGKQTNSRTHAHVHAHTHARTYRIHCVKRRPHTSLEKTLFLCISRVCGV